MIHRLYNRLILMVFSLGNFLCCESQCWGWGWRCGFQDSSRSLPLCPVTKVHGVFSNMDLASSSGVQQRAVTISYTVYLRGLLDFQTHWGFRTMTISWTVWGGLSNLQEPFSCLALEFCYTDCCFWGEYPCSRLHLNCIYTRTLCIFFSFYVHGCFACVYVCVLVRVVAT